METRLKGRLSLLFLAFAVVMMIFPAMALAQDAGDSTGSSSPAPTIQSDKDDYPPGGTVILTGSNWQPGESVHINVNDDLGKSWSRDVDVTADENGAIRDEFQLPDWFVATYSVKATGAQSGEATTSFTDAAVQLQGKSKQACVPKSANDKQCDGGYESVNLSGWQELDEIPLRLKFTGTGTYTVNVDFDHFKSSDKSPGVQDLYGWTAGTGVQLTKTPVLTKSTGDVWTYTLEAKVNTADAVVNFKGNLAAGAHYFTGSSLALSADNGAGTLQIAKPGAAPGSPDLAVKKTGPTSAGRDEIITYTLNYENKSSAATGATGVQLTDILPSGVTYVAGSCSGTCTVAGNEVTWNVGSLAKGASVSHTLQAKIPANAAFGTEYVNNARILSAENDANLADNTSSLKTTVSFNRAPSAVNDSLTTDEDTAKNIDVLANDSDPDGDKLSVSSFTQPTNGKVTQNADGTLKYEPAANFNGTDSFTYKAKDASLDSNSATVTITVKAVNDAPVAKDDSAETNEDTAVSISISDVLLANDSDVDGDSLSLKSFDATSLQDGKVEKSADGKSLTYTPKADFNGTDSFTYKATDGSLESNSAKVTINVKAVNDAPVASNDSAETNEDTAAIINVLSNDSDVDGDALSVANGSLSDPANGSVELITSGDDKGKVLYTPDENYNGNDSFTYKASDGTANSNEAKVSITVKAVNDAPVAKDDSASTDEDTAIASINVLSNDSDVDGDALSVSSFDATSAKGGTVSKNADGTLKYEPKANFNGEDSFTYKAKDASLESNEATVTIKVNAVNDAPVAKDDSAETDEDTKLTVDAPGVLANDSDVDGDSLTAAKVTGPADGTLTLNADGSFEYTPNKDFNGTDSFTYKAKDASLDSNSATVTITVKAVNDAPVAKDDSAETNEDTAANIDVLSNDSDVDGDALSVSSFTQPTNGKVTQNANGTLKYEPKADFNGTDSFTYKAKDASLESNEATVSITVKAVNDAPVAKDDSAATPEDTPLVISASDLLANDFDVEGDKLTITAVSNPVNGKVSLGNDGKITFTPDPNFYGLASFDYTVCDDGSPQKCSVETAIVKVTVSPVNDAPVAGNDSYSVDEDNKLTVLAADGVLKNDSDVDGDSLAATVVNEPTKGILKLNADGSFEYTPNADFSGTDSFTYKANDGELDSNVATVSITVKEVNDASTVSLNGAGTADEGDTKAYTFQITDPDSTNFSFVSGYPGCGGAKTELVGTPQLSGNSGSFQCRFLDGGAAPTVSVQVTDGQTPSNVASKNVIVSNVSPTITSLGSSSENVLAGTANHVTFTGKATDPSIIDLLYPGLSWQWTVAGSTYSFDPVPASGTPLVSTSSFKLGGTNNTVANFSTCGTHTVGAKVTDKDGGFAEATKSVNVWNAAFKAPLVDGTVNKVQKGQVVPVKISVGCATNLTGLSPRIDLLSGNISPETESGSTAVTASVSSADTGQIMRPVDGGYIYNLRVPDAAAGTKYTVRVNPWGVQPDAAAWAASSMYIVIEIRK